MIDRFVHKPLNTLWIGSELFVEYDCDSKPTKTDHFITGIKQFGFIVSHEYEVIPQVEGSRLKECHKEACEHAIKYELDVRYYIYEKVGLGFGLGTGTGTAGLTTRSTDYLKTFETQCICCAREESLSRADELRIVRLLFSVEERMRVATSESRLAWSIMFVLTIMLLLLFTELTFAILGYPRGTGFLVLTASLALVSTIVLVLRVVMYRVGRRELRS